ncbi:tape measure protein [Sphingomonas sp. Ag1]|uniref:tape measure protein n=2 Tax=Pseudomonadota TaxID=1224 RepID=UPI0009E45DDB|nr:tape measure protein [Sphingomonas sp. Ag1]
MSDTVVRIVIDASQATRGGSQAERALDRVGAATRRLDGALGRTTVNVTTFGRSLAGLKGAGAALILADLTRRAIEAADGFSLMDAKLKVATKNWGDHTRAQEDAMRIARTTRSELTSTAVLYGKLATTSKTLNASQAQVATATETVTKALKVSGASAGETASTVLQLGQALASGRLNGDEFRSLAENAPRLMKLIADSMGVPVGALKKMASEGQLTSDKLVRAFTDKKYLKELDEEFKLMPKTFADAGTAIENLATATFGAFNEGGQFSQALYDFADQGSENMKSIMDKAAETGGTIRDTFAGLYDAFQPLQEGGINAADEISARWRGLRDEIADVLGLIDGIRNFGRGYSLFGGDGSGAAIELSALNGTKEAPKSDMKGNFRLGFARSKLARSRAKANAELRERMGDPNFNPQDWTEAQYREAFQRYPRKPKPTGGTGVLRTPPGSATSGGNKSRGLSDAERDRRKAERDAERRLEQETRMFEQMEDQLAVARLMPVEAEKMAAYLELQRIRGKEITADDKKRLDDLLDQTRAAKLLSDIRAANDNDTAELNHQKAMLAMTDKEAAIAEATWEFERRALEDKVDITDELFQKELAIVKARAGETYEIQKQNRLLKDRDTLLSQYSPAEADRLQYEQLDFDRKRLGVLRGKSVADGGITEEQYQRAMAGIDRASAEIASNWQREFSGRIGTFGGQLGQIFSEVETKFGRAMNSLASAIEGAGRLLDGLAAASTGKFSGLGPIGGLIDILGTNRDGTSNALGKAAAEASKKSLDQLMGTNGQSSAFKNPLSSLSKGFGDFKGDMKNLFGKGGDFTKGLGSMLGKAGAGAGIGGVTNDLLGAVGIKLNKTGSQIGGALGGTVLGPLGAVGGSILGGLLGGLFSKPKSSSATFGMGADGYLTTSGQGSNKELTAIATGAAKSVMGGLEGLAQQLGGSITGTPNVTIGTWDGKWRVANTTTTKKLHSNNFNSSVLKDFGKDGEAEAIAYALQLALKQGVLTGISDFSSRVLKAATDLDKAINLATKYESIVKELAAVDDPIGAPLKELNKQFEALRKEMTANAATASELANVDRYYMIQRERMLEDQLSSIKSLQDKLMGPESGLSGKTRLDSSMAEFRKYQNDIAAGKTVDPTKFAELGNTIFDTARELYGTSGPMFQNIRSELLKANNDLKTNVESIYASGDGSTSVVAAVDKGSQLQAEAIKEAQRANTLNEQILAELQRANAINDNLPTSNVSASNGRQSGTV